MRSRPFLGIALAALACVASAALECNHRALTQTERRGQELYDRTCSVCHGRAGEGYAADQAPALSHPDFLASATNDFIRTSIAFGRNGTTMSAWAAARGGPLSPGDVDAIIAYMRSWQHGPPAVLDERALAGDAGRGSLVYGQRCASCHGMNGANGTNIHIGNLDFLALVSNGFLKYAITRGRRGTPMAAFGQVLGETGVEDVAQLIRSWQTAPAPSTALLTPPPPVGPIPLGPVPLNPRGPAPVGFRVTPATTPADTIKGELDRGARMALLDARAPSDYVNEHIAGAVSVPFYDPAPYFAGLPKDAWLVCYCACPHAESGQLAQKLVANGFTKVTVLDEGLGVWRARKYGTHTGASP